MPPSLSVVHVTAPATFGGLESVVAALAEGQRAQGDRVTVVTVLEAGADPDPHPFVAELEERGVPVRVFRLSARAYLEERRLLGRLLRELRPDVVHTHGFRPDVVDAGVARGLGIPVVTTVHGFSRAKGWKIRLYEALQIRSFRRFDAVVPVSRPLARELEQEGVPARRLHLLPNAWRPDAPPLGSAEARRALDLEPGGFHLGWIGRLRPEKGPDVLLESLAHLADLPWTASFVGDGPPQDTLEARAAELGLSDRIRWHGSVPGAARYLPAFDLVVSSSRTEGTPIVLLEAMAASRPVVATAVGGVPDLLQEAGRLVPPEDPAALAAAIRDLHGDGEARGALGEAARARLDEWADLEQWVAGYRDIYERARNEADGGDGAP